MLKNIVNAAVRAALGTRVLNHVAMSIGGTPTQAVTAAAVQYCIDGLTYVTGSAVSRTLTVTHTEDGQAVRATKPAYTQPISTTVIYVLAVNAAGTIAVIQGSYLGQTITDGLDLTKVITGTGAIPEVPSGYVAYGLVKVVTNGSATFVPGTTALNASGVTATLSGVSVLPATF